MLPTCNLGHLRACIWFSQFSLLQGIREETWEAFIADALFIAKVIDHIDAFAKLFTASFFDSQVISQSPLTFFSICMIKFGVFVSFKKIELEFVICSYGIFIINWCLLTMGYALWSYWLLLLAIGQFWSSYECIWCVKLNPVFALVSFILLL